MFLVLFTCIHIRVEFTECITWATPPGATQCPPMVWSILINAYMDLTAGFTWNPRVAGAPKCQQMQTSSQWRHMYNKGKQFENQFFIHEPKCKQETCRPDSFAIYNWLSGHRKFTKINFKHCSKSLIWPLGSHIWSLFALIHMQIWPKSKLGQVVVGLNIIQNHSYSL